LRYRLVVEIDFYGESEFEKWLTRLASQDTVWILQVLAVLEDAARPLGMPHGRNLKSDLWELRPQSGRSGYRIYYQVDGDVARMLTQGRKDTQQRDIARARRRMQ
jgi:putative addiction module killer protein